MIEELQGRATISIEEAGRYLSLSRASAYQAAREGTLPTLAFGRRRVVPVGSFLRMLGFDPPNSEGPATNGASKTIDTSTTKESP